MPPRRPPKTPYRAVAVIDVGSNATRLLISRTSPQGREVKRIYRRYPLRLGSDAFGARELSSKTTQNMVAVFEKIASQLQRSGVSEYRAVATSAMRDAKNSRAVLRQVKRASGLSVEVVSGAREAELARRAMMTSLGCMAPTTVLMDLGGGSLELQAWQGRPRRSLPFGTVRLVQKYKDLNDPQNWKMIRQVEKAVRESLAKHVKAFAKQRVAVGVGGNLIAAARMAPNHKAPVTSVDVAKLRAMIPKLAQMPVERRVQVYGLRQDRADLAVAAAIILSALATLLGIKQLWVPPTGLREGLLYELEPKFGFTARMFKGLNGSAQHQARTLAQRAEHSFEQLRPLHRLWGPAGPNYVESVLAMRVPQLSDLRSAQPRAIVRSAQRWLDEAPVLPKLSPHHVLGLLCAVEFKSCQALTLSHQSGKRLLHVGRDVSPFLRHALERHFSTKVCARP